MVSYEQFSDAVWSIFNRGNYTDSRYKVRLEEELKEIAAQMEHDYFFDLFKRQAKFKKNENNLFIVKLLRLADDFNINEPASFIIGEFPDVDSDFIPQIRDYLKSVWAPETFGVDNVCSIGNYTSFGIKSSLIDMARVHGKSRSEIIELTTKIGLKDEDGKAFTWEKVLEQHPLLQKYCTENPDVAETSQRLLNRNRGMGTHAAGLIIANQPINHFVPMVRGKDGQAVSAFVEGLHGTDLGPLGLVKCDQLGLITLLQIAKSVQLIKQRFGLTSICALPGLSDWSDESYLNDPKGLALANAGKLKCIFQFDSDGIRELAKRGGVTAFEDLVAYSSIFRPGPLGMKMDERYIERKRGREQYEIHPVLQPILGKTYGVMIFQEQVMRILRIVGLIPDMHCEIVRKAISKKKVKIFSRYKEMFVKNGQKVLNWTEERVNELWEQIESFSEYGFNKSHAVAYSFLTARMLWLKAYYPLEFFAAILSCEKDDSKIKSYKSEAESMGIQLKRLDINKSKFSFDIVDDTIYIGFSNIKGIGQDIGEQIVAGQPYSGIEDFLTRFGTSAKVLKPLIALRTFQETDLVKTYSYYEYFKSEKKKNEDMNIRFEKTKTKLTEEVRYILSNNCSPEDIHPEDFIVRFLDEIVAFFHKEKYEKIESCFEDFVESFELNSDKFKQLLSVVKKYKKSLEANIKKNEENKLISYEDFKSKGCSDEEMNDLFNDVIQISEEKFYGFSWDHLLEASPDYTGGHTFADFDSDETAFVRMCEVHVIEKPKEKKSAKGNPYCISIMEDSNSCPQMVTFWQEDWVRFKEELSFWESDSRKGHFLKIRLKKPDPPFKSYTFDAPFKQFRAKEIPAEKADDARLKIMARPATLSKEEKVTPLEQRTIIIN